MVRRLTTDTASGCVALPEFLLINMLRHCGDASWGALERSDKITKQNLCYKTKSIKNRPTSITVITQIVWLFLFFLLNRLRETKWSIMSPLKNQKRGFFGLNMEFSLCTSYTREISKFSLWHSGQFSHCSYGNSYPCLDHIFPFSEAILW